MDELFWTEIKVQEPEVVSLKDETPLAMSDDKDIKAQALQETRDAMEQNWIDINYLLQAYKDIAETATLETFKWNVMDDFKTKVSALKQMTDLWKTANNLNQKEPQTILFKPTFDKAPMLS